jgi:hypothetical protein
VPADVEAVADDRFDRADADVQRAGDGAGEQEEWCRLPGCGGHGEQSQSHHFRKTLG